MSGVRTAVGLLAVGQTLTYGGVYYAFPAILPDLEAATGWSKATLALGPTLAMLLMAIFTPLTGRLVDRGLGGEMLAFLPVPAAFAIALMGFAATPAHWLILWAIVGITQAGCLYETCFAFLTRRLGAEARPAIVRVTLIAGFSGTLSFPLGHWLANAFGPAGALIGFASLMILVAVPANLFGARILRASTGLAGAEHTPSPPGMVRIALRNPAFWMIGAILSLAYLNHGILITYVRELFSSRGANDGMVTLAAAMIGPSQVLGRFLLMLNEARVANRSATFAALGGLVMAALALWLAGVAPMAIFLVALSQGAGIGIISILRPVLIAEHLGREGFGAISGAIAIGPILASAAGPMVGAWLLGAGGPALVIAACAGLPLAAIILWATMRPRRAG
ncbi:MFS transporter [Frigidibacter sp. RF13]|uniref:MFS transporter n=1 Tax=Frigidibacter sp. RF13 TaxID=2997340 RepID=UPI00226ECCB8|nr:MFS transporter [Frigidibacter sp. RF13]MCY1127944.1 MFS transporter [Frigidibacter sp. RF13]